MRGGAQLAEQIYLKPETSYRFHHCDGTANSSDEKQVTTVGQYKATTEGRREKYRGCSPDEVILLVRAGDREKTVSPVRIMLKSNIFDWRSWMRFLVLDPPIAI